MTAIDIEKRLLYRDGLMLVIDKPYGLPVHSGPKGGENLTGYLDALRFGLPKIPELAHRLDRETSGCLVLGRHRQALAKLGQLFQSGQVDKTYLAVVIGMPPEKEGAINIPLAKKSQSKSSWWMKADPNGQPSETRYKLLDTNGGLSLLELKPVTGRTHQLRVHCSESGFPILGEKVYVQQEKKDFNIPLHLHSYSVEIPLYPKKPAIKVSAPLPEHMEATLKEKQLKLS